MDAAMTLWRLVIRSGKWKSMQEPTPFCALGLLFLVVCFIQH